MAVSSRFSYSTTAAVGGSHVANATRYIIMAQQELNRAVAIANEMTGGGVTPANLEGSAEFGVAVGQGATFYTAINNLKTNLATVTAAQLADLDAGG